MSKDWNALIHEEAKRRKSLNILEEMYTDSSRANQDRIVRVQELLGLDYFRELSRLSGCIEEAITEQMEKL